MEDRDERQRQRFEEEREQQNQQYNVVMKRIQEEHLQKINDIEQRHQRVLEEIHTKQDARLTVESARMVESRKEWQEIQLEKMKLQSTEASIHVYRGAAAQICQLQTCPQHVSLLCP